MLKAMIKDCRFRRQQQYFRIKYFKTHKKGRTELGSEHMAVGFNLLDAMIEDSSADGRVYVNRACNSNRAQR